MSAETRKAPSKRFAVVGLVTSASGEKTIQVAIDTLAKHPRYDKYVRRRSKLAVHDPKGLAGLGDRVEIAPCRPISKTKRWYLLRVVRRAELPVRSTQKA